MEMCQSGWVRANQFSDVEVFFQCFAKPLTASSLDGVALQIQTLYLRIALK